MTYQCTNSNGYDVFSGKPRRRKYKQSINNSEYDLSPLCDADVTDSERNQKYLFHIPSSINILSNSMEIINKITDETQKQKIIAIVSTFEEIVVSLKSKLEEMNLSLPPLYFSLNEEDNSILIEWIFYNFRIGISVEKDTTKSFWYLVSREVVDKNLSGDLKEYNLFDLILSLFQYVLNNM